MTTLGYSATIGQELRAAALRMRDVADELEAAIPHRPHADGQSIWCVACVASDWPCAKVTVALTTARAFMGSQP